MSQLPTLKRWRQDATGHTLVGYQRLSLIGILGSELRIPSERVYIFCYLNYRDVRRLDDPRAPNRAEEKAGYQERAELTTVLPRLFSPNGQSNGSLNSWLDANRGSTTDPSLVSAR